MEKQIRIRFLDDDSNRWALGLVDFRAKHW